MSVLDRLVVQGKSFSAGESYKPCKIPTRRELITLYRLSQIRKRKETKLDQVVPADHDGSESDRSRGVVSPGRCDDVPCDSYRYKVREI